MRAASNAYLCNCISCRARTSKNYARAHLWQSALSQKRPPTAPSRKERIIVPDTRPTRERRDIMTSQTPSDRHAGLGTDQATAEAGAACLIARFRAARPKRDCTPITFRVSAIRKDGLIALQFLTSSREDAESLKRD